MDNPCLLSENCALPETLRGRQKTMFFDGYARAFPAAKTSSPVFAAVGKS
jgi:hypothetical protein